MTQHSSRGIKCHQSGPIKSAIAINAHGLTLEFAVEEQYPRGRAEDLGAGDWFDSELSTSEPPPPRQEKLVNLRRASLPCSHVPLTYLKPVGMAYLRAAAAARMLYTFVCII